MDNAVRAAAIRATLAAIPVDSPEPKDGLEGLVSAWRAVVDEPPGDAAVFAVLAAHEYEREVRDSLARIRAVVEAAHDAAATIATLGQFVRETPPISVAEYHRCTDESRARAVAAIDALTDDDYLLLGMEG